MPSARQAGFTLIELLVVVTVAVVLISLALPDFRQSIRSNRVSTTTNEVLASLSLARTEAIKGVGVAGVCPSSDGTTCAGTTEWEGGWVIWRTDATAGGTVQTVVRYVQAKEGSSVTGPADGVEFNVQGRTVDGAARVGVAPAEGDGPARCVMVNAAGQTRIEKGACT
jgi:type IV fimbrial biogenesis protein FimT